MLGPASADEQAPENTDIAIQRIHLIEQKDKLDSSLKTLAGLKASATELTTQIAAPAPQPAGKRSDAAQ